MTELQHGAYVHLDVLPNGNLRVTLTKEGLEELDDLHLTHPEWNADTLFFELYTENDSISRPDSNGGPLFMDSIETLDGGHMSQAPCIVTAWDTVDDHDGFRKEYVPDWVRYETTEASKVWYWNEYCIISILDHIKRQGEAVLTLLT